VNVSTSIKVELGPVQETLLIPLLGRAEETKKKRGLLRDEKAVEIVDRLEYDFGKWRRAKSLVGTSIRTRMFDRYVERFLTDHPTSTIVELGCGLNTRFERVDNGRLRWFDLDLPDVIALRRRFFEDEPRRTMLACSVLDPEWMEPVAATGGPWLFVSEAVLIYLQAAEVRRAILQLANRFPRAELVFDTTDRACVSGQGRHDAMRHLPKESWFRWACDDPKEVEAWSADLEVVESKTFAEADADIVQRMPFSVRLVVRWLPFLLLRKLRGYRLNRVRIGSRSDILPERPALEPEQPGDDE
jgi:O-methyltransferase involved in polyketide biosynthesis